MANVLPLDVRKQVWRAFRARFVLVGSLAALAGAFFTFLALLPGMTGLYLQNLVSEDTSTVSLPASGDANNRIEILRAQSLVTQFSTIISSTTPAFDAFLAALQARPQGALIREIRYTKEGERSSIIVYGSAKDRTSISLYRDALAKDTRFQNILIPASALAGAEEGRYSITLTGKF